MKSVSIVGGKARGIVKFRHEAMGVSLGSVGKVAPILEGTDRGDGTKGLKLSQDLFPRFLGNRGFKFDQNNMSHWHGCGNEVKRQRDKTKVNLDVERWEMGDEGKGGGGGEVGKGMEI